MGGLVPGVALSALMAFGVFGVPAQALGEETGIGSGCGSRSV